MYLPQKKSADAKYAPRAAAQGPALRTVKVLTSHQVLPEPLLTTISESRLSTRHDQPLAQRHYFPTSGTNRPQDGHRFGHHLHSPH